MRSGKAILAGAVAAVALAGGGAAVLAARDGDDRSGPSIVLAPPPSDQEPSPAPAPERDPAPDPEVEAPTAPQEPDAPAVPKAGGRPGGGKPRATRFPHERRKDPAKSGKRFAVPPAQEFTGRGNALIGTVDVKAPAVVRWRARGRFGLEFGREAFPIIAPSHRGELVIPPYRFEQVRVLAAGRWRIVITPQG